MSFRLFSGLIIFGCLTGASSVISAAKPPLPSSFRAQAAEGYSIGLVAIDPVAGTPLVAGSSVTFKISVAYKNAVSLHGKIVLIFQDEKDRLVTSGGPQVSADAPGPNGKASLEKTVTVPTQAKELRLFVPFVPDGLIKTSDELMFRYPIKKSRK